MDSSASFVIDFEPIASGNVARLVVYGLGHCLTRLLRDGENAPSEHLIVPPEMLAHWFVENWWRLRWEPVPAGTNSPPDAWRMAHDMRSIGGGFAWPNLLVWGEDTRVCLRAHPDPLGVAGPVRFLSDASGAISARNFEAEVDRFLDSVRDTNDDGGFGQLVRALRAERSDSEVAAWRRLEARLGFDPGDAPDSVMTQLGELVARFRERDIEEAASAAPGAEAAGILQEEIAAATGMGGWDCNPQPVSDLASQYRSREQAASNLSTEAPWRQGEQTAKFLRATLTHCGPVGNSLLSELLGIQEQAIGNAQHHPCDSLKPLYALLVTEERGHRFLPRSKWLQGRRFELARLVGDLLYNGPAQGRSLAPIALSRTHRQKFQRSFAANFLCPIDELVAYMATDSPEEDDMTAAASHFSVSPTLVKSTLMNHGKLPRTAFQEVVEAL